MKRVTITIAVLLVSFLFVNSFSYGDEKKTTQRISVYVNVDKVEEHTVKIKEVYVLNKKIYCISEVTKHAPRFKVDKTKEAPKDKNEPASKDISPKFNNSLPKTGKGRIRDRVAATMQYRAYRYPVVHYVISSVKLEENFGIKIFASRDEIKEDFSNAEKASLVSASYEAVNIRVNSKSRPEILENKKSSAQKDLFDTEKAKKAPIVLRVRKTENIGGSKYTHYKVKVLHVYKNTTKTAFKGSEIQVAFPSSNPFLPEGECTIYIIQYNSNNPQAKGLWRSALEYNEVGFSHVKEIPPKKEKKGLLR